MLIGAHVSPSGGLPKAIERGSAIGADCIQIFNQSPRMWRPTAYGEDDFQAFCQAKEASQIKAVLIHAVYLLNCASEDAEIRAKTLTSLVQSLRVGTGIGASGVVLHPGSAKAGDVGKAESEGCALHLEDTAGAGGTLGRSFEELAALIEAAGGHGRLGICLDSCHLLASGYDVRTREGLDDTLAECGRLVGLDRLHSLHLNDSMMPLGSNRDRHAVPGEGELGAAGLAVFASEQGFQDLPVVLETGRDDGKVTAEDIELIRKLRIQGQSAK